MAIQAIPTSSPSQTVHSTMCKSIARRTKAARPLPMLKLAIWPPRIPTGTHRTFSTLSKTAITQAGPATYKFSLQSRLKNSVGTSSTSPKCGRRRKSPFAASANSPLTATAKTILPRLNKWLSPLRTWSPVSNPPPIQFSNPASSHTPTPTAIA